MMVPAIFDISFWCTDESTSMALEGVDITIDGVIITSDINGLSLFEEYSPGSYDYIASKFGYVTQMGTVIVVDGDIDVDILMSLAYYDILFLCKEEGNLAALEGVDVNIDGVTVTSNSNGIALFSDYAPGSYFYSASKDGYITETGTVNVIGSTVAENVFLSLNAFDMFFWCLEQGNPMGLEGVDITIDGETVTSDFDGLALFEGYAPGNYDYSASKDGYLTENGTVTIVDSNVEEFVELSQLYSVLFILDDGVAPIEGAEVNFNGSIVLTDENGEAIFTDVVSGTYDYSISMDGYVIQNGTVDIIDENVTLPITLISTGINDQSYFSNINIYPNPSRGNINIDNAENSTVWIVDQHGNIILEDIIRNDHSTINLTAKPAGLYNIILISGNNKSSYKFLIVR